MSIVESGDNIKYALSILWEYTEYEHRLHRACNPILLYLFHPSQSFYYAYIMTGVYLCKTFKVTFHSFHSVEYLRTSKHCNKVSGIIIINCKYSIFISQLFFQDTILIMRKAKL